MENNVILRKPTATIHISNPFSFGEQKLLNMLMYNAQTLDGLSDEENSVSLEDIYFSLGWKSDKNEQDIKEYLRTLVSTPIEWNEKRIDKSLEWTICTFLSKGKISKGRLNYRINPEIVAQVKTPTMYAKMILLAQTQLRKKHSLVLYEYFQSELGRYSNDSIFVHNVQIDFLLSLLGQQGSDHYQKYKHLNQDIIKPSLKEINSFTDIEIYHERVAKGKKTIGVDFWVKKRSSFQLSLDLKGGSSDKNSKELEYDELTSLLQYYGVTAKIAINLINKYSVERIQGNIQHLKEELLKGKKIANKGAWLRKAIEDNYQPQKSTVDTDLEKERKITHEADFQRLRKIETDKNRIRNTENRLKKLENEYSTFKMNTLKDRFEKKDTDFRVKWQNDFLNRMREEKHTMVLGLYQTEKLGSSFVCAVFFSELLQKELLTEPYEQSIEAFGAWKANKL